MLSIKREFKRRIRKPTRRQWLSRHMMRLVLLTTPLCVMSCNDSGTKPRPIQEILYVGARHTTELPFTYRIYGYELDSLSLVDSLTTTDFPADLEVSEDGNWLYVGLAGVLKVQRVDAKTGSTDWEVPRLGPIQLVNDGNVLICGNQIRDSKSGALLSEAPDTLVLTKGNPNSTIMSAVVSEAPSIDFGDSVIIRYDIENGNTSGRYVPRVNGELLEWIYEVQLHPNSELVGVIGIRNHADDAWFVIGNLQTGRTLLAHRLVEPFGNIAISADGRFAAVSDPRSRLHGGTNTLDVFDLEEMKHLKRFRRSGLFDPDSITFTGQVHFDHTSQQLISVPGVGRYGRIHLIDLGLMQPYKSTGLPGSEIHWSVPDAGGSSLGFKSGNRS